MVINLLKRLVRSTKKESEEPKSLQLITNPRYHELQKIRRMVKESQAIQNCLYKSWYVKYIQIPRLYH